jgi:hypothetical protein
VSPRRTRGGPQVRRGLTLGLLPDRGLGVLVLDLRRLCQADGGFKQFVVVDRIGAHLLGAPARRAAEAPRGGRVLRAARRRREEVHGVGVDVALLEVSRVVGYRAGVVVVGVGVLVRGGFGLEFGLSRRLELVDVAGDTVGGRYRAGGVDVLILVGHTSM